MNQAETQTGTQRYLLERSEVILSFGLLGVLVVLLVPLPPVLLDMLLAMNLAITILLLLITVSVKQPLDISVFPSLLLLMTLFRLSLNVATTRLILLDGDAGKIVSTFGGFVVGGNLVVGLVIFLILIVIQFIVITKGSTRVSEVAARFTLDALPGKQMAIDAELSGGSIDEVQAKERRHVLTQEAEFYGAMDGAGKFVRGDAIAGLVITGINLLGGVVLGMTNGLTIGQAITRFSILTIGDGLVSQIPALIIATSAGILVTKATTKISLGSEIGSQMMSNHRPLMIGAVILAVVALTPGLPKIPFFAIAGIVLFVARQLKADAEKPVEVAKEVTEETASPERNVDEFLQTELASVELGVRLIPLVETKNGHGLAERIRILRRDLTKKHGIWVPSIRLRDSLQLDPNTYRILIGGREVARAELRTDKLLGIDPGNAQGELDGEDTTDPAFGLPAKWVASSQRHRAELKGFTVVDPPSVLITHLGEVLTNFAPELFSREDMRQLLDKVRETSPTVVEELKPDVIRMGELHQVLVLLLQERVPLTNLTRILEVVAQVAHHTKDPVVIADQIRAQMGRDILDHLREEDGRIKVAVLDPRLEMKLRESVRDALIQIPHDALERLVGTLHEHWQKSSIAGTNITLLCDAVLRRPLRRSIERSVPELSVTAYTEVPPDIAIDFAHILRLEDVFPESSATNSPNAAERRNAPEPTPVLT